MKNVWKLDAIEVKMLSTSYTSKPMHRLSQPPSCLRIYLLLVVGHSCLPLLSVWWSGTTSDIEVTYFKIILAWKTRVLYTAFISLFLENEQLGGGRLCLRGNRLGAERSICRWLGHLVVSIVFATSCGGHFQPPSVQHAIDDQ